MATKYEYYTTGDDNVTQFYNAYWVAQLFTVGAAAHTITSVKVKLWRSGATPGTVYLGIRATSGGKPTGNDLTSGSMAGADVTTSWNGVYYEIPVTELPVAANTTYAIVLRAPNATGGSVIGFAADTYLPTYSGGYLDKSSDSGASWSIYDDQDCVFEVWGNPASTPISASDSGVGSDAVSIGLSVADSGVGAESSPTIGPLGTDAGVGVESVTASAEMTVLETGAGVESAALALSVNDQGEGVAEATIGPSVEGDGGVGVDVVTAAATMTVPDAGVGVESPSIAAAVPSSDSGVGVETPGIQTQLTETDAGLGVDSPGIVTNIPASESGVGVETPSITAGIPALDSGHGAESAVAGTSLTVSDSGLGLENVATPGTLTVLDEGKGAEFAWRVKPSSTMIDALALPHVLSIRITDPATMSDKKVQGGSLPRRKMVAKAGRTVEIGGWSDSQTEIDAVDALRDGLHHTFYPPTGDSFSVLVTGFEPNATADEYNRRTYRLSLAEAN